MITCRGLPLNLGTDSDLREFVTNKRFGVRPGYTLPVEETVAKCVQADWEQFRKFLSQELLRCSAANSGWPFVSLLHDLCTFVSKDTCLGYSIGFINLEWQYVLLAVGLLPHNFSHKAVDVAKSIREDFESRFGIPISSTFSSVRSDTTASALKVAASFDLEGEMCTMHLLNLVQLYAIGILHRPNDSFQFGESLVLRHSALANHFSRSTMDLDVLEQHARLNGVVFFKPSPRNDTRVSSTTEMMAVNLANRSAYELMFRAKDIDWEHSHLRLSRLEWKAASEIEGSLRV